jgi:hypothetical protein
MKLHTSITPRRDGTVRVTGQDGQAYVFEVDADGELSCDVADEATLAWMLATGNFYPANPDDAERALGLVKAAAPEADEADPDDDLDDDAAPDALPVEADTPPAPKKPGRKPKVA